MDILVPVLVLIGVALIVAGALRQPRPPAPPDAADPPPPDDPGPRHARHAEPPAIAPCPDSSQNGRYHSAGGRVGRRA